jgi:hypothetical protein
MGPTGEASPRLKARISGVFYLLEMLTGGFALFVGGRLLVSGDAAATATNILAHESIFRLGFAANFIQFACYVVVTGLFYDLFKPVNKSLSLLAAFFSLVGCAIGAVSCLYELAPLAILGGAQYLNVFKVEQLQALALMFLKLHGQWFNLSFVFFGFYCLLIGYLISPAKEAKSRAHWPGCSSVLMPRGICATRVCGVDPLPAVGPPDLPCRLQQSNPRFEPCDETAHLHDGSSLARASRRGDQRLPCD